MATATCSTKAGPLVAAGRVAWAGTSALRSRVNWLPAANVPLSLDGKLINPVWYRALQEVFENRLGGINAKTVPEVVSTTEQTQSQVLSVQTGVQSIGTQVVAITDAVNTTTQVAQNNNLSGSTQIPRLPSYKLQQLNGLENQ